MKRGGGSLDVASACICALALAMSARARAQDPAGACAAAFRSGENRDQAFAECSADAARARPAPAPVRSLDDCRKLLHATPRAATGPRPPALWTRLRTLDLDRLAAGDSALFIPERWLDAQTDQLLHALDRLCLFRHPNAHKPECSDAFGRFDAQLRAALAGDGPRATTALRAMLESREGRGCNGSVPAPAGEGQHYLSIAGYQGDRITIFELPPVGVVAEPRVYALGVPLWEDGTPAAEQLSVAVVPEGVPVLVRIENAQRRPQQPFALFRPDVIGHDGTPDVFLDTRVSASACLEFDLTLPAGAHVLVDGWTLQVATRLQGFSAKLPVLPGKHTVSVLVRDAADPGAGERLRLSDEREVETTGPGCVQVSHDASERTRERIVLLPLHVDADCGRAGVNEIKLRERIQRFAREHRRPLEAAARELRDFSDVADFARGLAGFDELVAALRGDATGRARGQDDSAQRLGGVAKEIRRQGFDRLISMSLSCYRVEAGWEYSTVARSVDLNRAQQCGPNALEWDGVFDAHTALLTDPHELYDGLVAPLARLLGLPYVHFKQAAEPQRFASDIRVAIELYDPQRAARFDPGSRHRCAQPPARDAPEADARPPSSPSTPVLRVWRFGALDCEHVAQSNQLRARAFTPQKRDESALQWTDTDAAFREAQRSTSLVRRGDWMLADDQDAPRSVEIAGNPLRPGNYLLQSGLAGSELPQPSYRCLQITSEDAEYFFSLTRHMGVLAADSTLQQRYDRLLLRAGIGWRDGWSAVVGFGASTRTGLVPDSAPGSPREYRVLERSLLVGPALSWQPWLCPLFGSGIASGCSASLRRLHAIARVMTLLDLAFLELDDDAGPVFPEQRGEPSDVDIDLTLIGELGAGIRLGDRHNVRVLFSLAVPKLFDMAEPARRRRAGYDGRLSLAFGAEYAGTL